MAGRWCGRTGRVVLAAVLILAGWLVGDETARAGSKAKTVVTTGAGRIYKDDIANARERAIAMGLVAAVDRVVADRMSREDRVRNFEVLSMSIYADIHAYIQGYKVLTETRAGKKYHVLIEAAVSDKKVGRQLAGAGLFQTRKTMPKVLLLIAERNLWEGPPSYWWNENPLLTRSTACSAMARKMAEQGFPIIDASGENARAAAAVFRHKPLLADTEAMAIGARLKAQIVVIGEADVEMAPNEMSDGSRTFKGTVRARAIRLDMEKEIAVADQSFSAVHIEPDPGAAEALSGGGALAGETLAALISDNWSKEAEKPAGVEMIVEGVSNLKYFALFRRTLKGLPGVQDVQRKKMTLNEATLIVHGEEDARALARRLMLQTFDSFGLNIYEVTEGALKIKLIPNAPPPSTTPPTATTTPATTTAPDATPPATTTTPPATTAEP